MGLLIAGAITPMQAQAPSMLVDFRSLGLTDNWVGRGFNLDNQPGDELVIWQWETGTFRIVFPHAATGPCLSVVIRPRLPRASFGGSQPGFGDFTVADVLPVGQPDGWPELILYNSSNLQPSEIFPAIGRIGCVR